MSKNKKIIITVSIAFGICAVSFVLLTDFPFAVVDCGWDDTAFAWIDENQNGVWDRGEKPLADVQFIADDIRHDYDSSPDVFSDANGKAWVDVFPVDCTGFDEISIVIRAIPPQIMNRPLPAKFQCPKTQQKIMQTTIFFLASYTKTGETCWQNAQHSVQRMVGTGRIFEQVAGVRHFHGDGRFSPSHHR